MSGLADDLEAAVVESTKPSRYGCSVCKSLSSLTSDESESLRKALASPMGAKSLSLLLRRHGIAVGVPSIHFHRKERHGL
jgi:hypothetical protein